MEDVTDDMYNIIDDMYNIIDDMYEAINMHELEDVKFLLPLMKDPYYEYAYTDGYKYTGNILLISLKCHAYTVFEYLATKLDVDHSDDCDQTLLIRVIKGKQKDEIFDEEDILRVLHYANNINHFDKYNQNALMYAIISMKKCFYYMIESNKKRSLEIVKIFIDKGADPFIRRNGISAIDVAILDMDASFNKMDILNILLSTSIKKHVNLYTIKHIIVSKDKNSCDYLELLLPYVKNINDTYKGHTLLWHAHQNNANPNIIELLTESGAI